MWNQSLRSRPYTRNKVVPRVDVTESVRCHHNLWIELVLLYRHRTTNWKISLYMGFICTDRTIFLTHCLSSFLQGICIAVSMHCIFAVFVARIFKHIVSRCLTNENLTSWRALVNLVDFWVEIKIDDWHFASLVIMRWHCLYALGLSRKQGIFS